VKSEQKKRTHKTRTSVYGRIAVAILSAAVCAGAFLAAPTAAHADGGPFKSPVAVINTNGTWEEFWIGSDCHVYHAWGAVNQNGPYPSSGSLGGCAIASNGLDVGRNNDGRLEVFVRGTDGAIWHNWQTRPSSGPWSGWYSLGNFYVESGPTVRSVFSGDAYMQVWAVRDDTWYVDYQTQPGCCWSGWRQG
jgi:hypothetical protein